MNPPICLFILGVAGTGKSTLTDAFVQAARHRGQVFVPIDKDTLGNASTRRVIELTPGATLGDRDSALYQREIRDLEYGNALSYAAELLARGFNVVMPAPWTNEIVSGALTDANRLGLGPCQLRHARLATGNLDTLRSRIEQRANPMDQYKLAYWERFCEKIGKYLALPIPGVIELESDDVEANVQSLLKALSIS